VAEDDLFFLKMVAEDDLSEDGEELRFDSTGWGGFSDIWVHGGNEYGPQAVFCFGAQTEAQTGPKKGMLNPLWRQQSLQVPHNWRCVSPETFPISFALLPLHPSLHRPPAASGADTTPAAAAAAAAHGILLGQRRGAGRRAPGPATPEP
jgi:hypothetical protein